MPEIFEFGVLQRVARIASLALLTLLLLGGSPPLRAADSFDEGVAAYEAGRWQDAARVWQTLAERGDARSQHAIGSLYESGRGVPQSYARAAEWYAKAAQQGLPNAQNDLAVLFSKGRGVDRDPIAAVKLWQAAAAQGHAKAQYNLGLAYYLGEGVAIDDRAAQAWFTTAAKSGLPEAQFILAQMFRMGVGVEADQVAALAWYERAAAQGHDEAQAKADELIAAGVKPIGPVEGPLPAATAAAEAESETVELAAAPASGVPVAAATEPASSSASETLSDEAVKIPAIVITPAAVDEANAKEAAAAGEPVPPPLKPEKPVELAALTPPEEVGKPATVVDAATVAAPPPAAPAATPDPAATPEPAASAAPAEAQVAMLTAKPGDGLLWLGTGADEAEAEGLAGVLGARFPEVFQQLPPRIEGSSLGGKTRWRVLAGPLDPAAAAELCAALRAVEPNLFCKALPPA
jgi:TPR repeat protein